MSKLRKLARKLGVKKTDDPEGVMAVLQVGRRLVQDEGYAPSEALLRAANQYAAPIDSGRAFWAAHYALTMAGYSEWMAMDAIEQAEIDVLVPIFDAAIRAQGQMNLKVKRR